MPPAKREAFRVLAPCLLQSSCKPASLIESVLKQREISVSLTAAAVLCEERMQSSCLQPLTLVHTRAGAVGHVELVEASTAEVVQVDKDGARVANPAAPRSFGKPEATAAVGGSANAHNIRLQGSASSTAEHSAKRSTAHYYSKRRPSNLTVCPRNGPQVPNPEFFLGVAGMQVAASETFQMANFLRDSHQNDPLAANLMQLYEAWGGEQWLNNSGWEHAAWTGSWYGFERYGSLNLSCNLLRGTLPSKFAAYTGVEALTLSYNLISGSIPVQLGDNLIALVLGDNLLSGTIPTQLGRLTNLSSTLALTRNSLSGTIPTQVGRLTNLSGSLTLMGNRLSGTIPTQLGRLTNLQKHVTLRHNRLSGTFPSQLGQLSHL